MDYVHYSELCCRTNFSFLQSASHPEALVRQAHALGYRSLAITDECSLAGVVKAYTAARSMQLPLIIGSLFKTSAGLTLIVLATSRRGYAQLSDLITRCRRQAPKGEYRFSIDWLAPLQNDCLIIWRPCFDATLTPEAQRLILSHNKNLWTGLTLHEDDQDLHRCQSAIALQQLTQLPLVACGDILQHEATCQPLLDTLTAIRLRQPVHACGFALPRGQGHMLRPLGTLKNLYPGKLIEETQHIHARCQFDLGSLRYEYPAEIVPEGYTPQRYLINLVKQGMEARYPRGTSEKVHKLIQKELSLIASLEYAPYFLTVFDIVSFARSRGILCQGRGSAANSAVCFC
jgi:error-prone DNA polymerase